MPVCKTDLYTNGRPIRGLRGALCEWGCETLEELEAKIVAENVTLEDFMNRHLKGNGSRWSPGRVPRYLFKIEKSPEKSKFLGFYWAWLSPTGELLPSTIRRKSGDSDAAFSGTDQKYKLRRVGQECTQVKVRVTQIMR